MLQFGGCSWRRSYSHSCERPQRKFSRFLAKAMPRASDDSLRITLMEWKSPQTRRGALFFVFFLLLRLCHMGIFLRLFVIKKNAMTLNSLELVNHQIICRKYKQSS